jgi:hypothetical protein
LSDLSEAVHGTVVKDLLLSILSDSSRLHHESSSHGVQGVGHQTGHGGDVHGVKELENHVVVLAFSEDQGLARVVATKIQGSVGDDTQDGDRESLVKAEETIGFVNLGQTVEETVELSFSLADISGETGTGEVQGVHEAKGSSTGGTTRGEVTKEKFETIGLGVKGAKVLLEGVLECEVKGLGREITDDVSEITTVKSANTLGINHTSETVTDTSVAGNFSRLNLRVSVLSL